MTDDDKTPTDTDIDEAYDDSKAIDDAYADDTEDVVEVPAEEENATKDKKKRARKPKKARRPLSKTSKMIIIAVTIILVIALLSVAIAVPVSMSNRDKIFVHSEEDFANTSGKIYVLKNNITARGELPLSSITNIDLNGYTLTVEGKFKINNTGDGDVLVGTGEADHVGTIVANEVEIISNKPVVLGAILKANSISITAPSVTINEGINLVEDSEIISKEIVVNAPIEFANSAKSNLLGLINADKIDIRSKISGNLSIKNTLISEKKYPTEAYIYGAIYGNILADKTVCVTINNKVTGKIDTNASSPDGSIILSKVGKVILEDDAFVKNIRNAEYVLVSSAAVYPNMTAVTKVNIVRVLEGVKYIDVNRVEDKLLMTFSTVQNADDYIVLIDGKAVAPETRIDANTYDITEYVVKSPSAHMISVQAISKANSEIFTPSRPLVCEYTARLTLDMATNINIDKVENKWMLTWDAVAFASDYVVHINGKELKPKTNSLDVTQYINVAGSNTVGIIARSTNYNISASKPAMYVKNIMSKIDEIELSIIVNHPNMQLKWNKVDHAAYYEILVVGAEGDSVIYRTTDTQFATSKDAIISGHQIKSGDRFKVRAVSRDQYYEGSTSNDVTLNWL